MKWRQCSRSSETSSARHLIHADRQASASNTWEDPTSASRRSRGSYWSPRYTKIMTVCITAAALSSRKSFSSPPVPLASEGDSRIAPSVPRETSVQTATCVSNGKCLQMSARLSWSSSCVRRLTWRRVATKSSQTREARKARGPAIPEIGTSHDGLVASESDLLSSSPAVKCRLMTCSSGKDISWCTRELIVDSSSSTSQSSSKTGCDSGKSCLSRT
mmetsp:Transcript_14544/g.54954  ORF Transcript_14544/g.54954 Transcript_14544/m.54954 type:complete len:217 (+) Transcript_14544:3243-3893(+)|eukprot:scaffold1435_cov267-Pinguiococcus_pyrenoidosus.AAC.53